MNRTIAIMAAALSLVSFQLSAHANSGAGKSAVHTKTAKGLTKSRQIKKPAKARTSSMSEMMKKNPNMKM